MDVVGLLVGSGWAAGINLYGVAFLLGVAGRLGWDDVPEVLTRTDVMVAAAVLYLSEFLVDKVPYLDNVWDAVHTVIRPLGAAAIGYLIVGDASSLGEALGAVVAGALAFSAHSVKATTRAVANTSPEPVSNILLSLGEDGLAAGVVTLGIWLPVAAVVVVLVLVAAGTWVVVRLGRSIGRRLRRRKAAG